MARALRLLTGVTVITRFHLAEPARSLPTSEAKQLFLVSDRRPAPQGSLGLLLPQVERSHPDGKTTCALLLALLISMLFVMTGCGAGGYAGTGVVNLSASAITIDAGQAISITGQSGSTLTWTLSGSNCSGTACGTLSSSTGNTITYTAPSGLTSQLKPTLQAGIAGTPDTKLVSITVNPDPTITGNPPSGVVGTPYSATITANGGTAPLTLSLKTGSLPPGLTFNAATGLISGTPTATGNYSFVLQATDTSNIPYTVTATEQIAVTAVGAALEVVGGNPPSGVVGSSYSAGLQAAGGTQPYTWSVVAGALPAGLTLAPTTGLISGTPTAAGTSSFTAQAQDATGATATGSFAITITNASGQTSPTITVTSLPNGMVNTPYTATIGVTGGTAPYNCTLTSGTLPAGLSLGAGCVVSGTPTTAGTVNLGVQATDSSNPAQTTNGPVSLTITPAALMIGTGTLPGGTVGTPYSAPIGATGGTAPYSCAITAGTLPAGLTLSSGCVVSGTPTTAGTATVTVKGTDSGNPAQSGSGTETITIAPPALAITTGTLPNGMVGTPYTATIGVTGGTAPYSCAIASGTLPAGLTLAANCAVSGTPTVAGTSNLTVKATDASNPANSTTGPVSVTISAAPMLTITSPPAATVGSPYTGTIPVAGGTGPYSCTITGGTLPAGLALGTNCQVTGTPTTAGSTPITVQATDSSAPARTSTGPITITVNPNTPTLTVSSPPVATVGTPYTGTIPVTGGTAPYSCTIASGTVPAGLALGANCALTGTPTTADTYPVSVTATDSATPADTTTGPATITVQPMPALTFTGSLPNGVVGQPYSQVLQASGGVAPYTYAVTAGTLPAGLTLSTGGVVSGTPTTPGASSFTVTATDSEGTPQAASLPLVLLITYPPTANDAELTGPYAFLFQGYDDVAVGLLAYQTATVGSFSANGAGVVSTGELDSNHQGSAPTGTTISTQNFVGTYTVGTDGRGSLTLTSLNADGTAATTSTYAIALKTPTAPATVATQGSLIEADNNQVAGTRGSGTLLAQTASAFAAGLNGSYAFGVSGDTPCLPACTVGIAAGPVAAVGQFTTDGAGAISSGSGDANIAATNYPNATLSGSYGTADANGRLQLSLSQSDLPSNVYPTDYAVYLVDGSHALLMSTDKHSAYILQAGSATLQTTATFSNASMTGNYVGYENSPTNPGLVGQSLENVLNLSTSTIFQGIANGAGSCITNHVDVGGTTGLVNTLTGLGATASVLQTALGAYDATGTSTCTVAAIGREVLNYVAPNVSVLGIVTVTGNAPAPRVAYLYGVNQGYFLETGYAGLGMLADQTGSPYTLGTLDGTYVEATIPASSVATTNSSGVFTADGAGNAQTTLDENVGVGTVNVIQLGNTNKSTYTLTDATAGRFLLGTNTVIYAISPTRFVLLDIDPLVTSPSVALLY